MTATGWPALTMREGRQVVRDIEDLRHWTDRCWCGGHAEGTPEVPPPWAAETGEGPHEARV